MVISSDIFALIKSLSSSEKRYFRLFANIHEGEKDYLRLFEAIDALEKYDENFLRKKFRDEPFSKRFSAAKNYLYRQILRSLRAYHSSSSVSAEVREELHNIEILHEKGLITQAEKLLRRVKKLCEKFEKDALFLECLRLEEQVSYSRDAVNNLSYESFENIFSASEKILQKLSFDHDLHKLVFQLSYDSIHTRDRKNSNENFESAIQKLCESDEDSLSVLEKIDKNVILGLWNSISKNPEKYYQNFSQAHSLFLNNTHLIKEEIHSFISITFYLIQTQNILHKNDELIETVRQLRTEANRQERLQKTAEAKIFFSGYFWEIYTLLGIGEYENAKKIIPELERGLKIFKEQIPYYFYILLELFIGLTHYQNGDLKKSLSKINFVLSQKKHLNHDSYFCYLIAVQANLFIHFELQNIDVIESAFLSVKRLTAGETIKLSAPTKSIFEFFSELLRTEKKSEEIKILKKLRNDMENFLGDAKEAKYVSLIGLRSFIQRCEKILMKKN